MEERIALISIIVEDWDSVEDLNQLLHDYSEYIMGRMGLPCSDKGLNLISIAICADGDKISALSGKLGRLKGINTKTVYAKTGKKNDENT